MKISEPTTRAPRTHGIHSEPLLVVGSSIWGRGGRVTDLFTD